MVEQGLSLSMARERAQRQHLVEEVGNARFDGASTCNPINESLKFIPVVLRDGCEQPKFHQVKLKPVDIRHGVPDLNQMLVVLWFAGLELR